MPQFDKHVFVCTNVRETGHPRGCCSGKDSEAVREAFKEAVKQLGLKRRVRINAAGCLDHCEHGPTVVVYPEGVWYGFVTPADAPEIVERHLEGGVPVKRLVIRECPVKSRGAG